MKRLFIVLCLFFSCAFKTYAAPETFTLDPNHTYVLWHADHFGFSHPSGKWLAQGTLILDKDKAQNDKVDVTIQMDTLDTAIPELDKHLKGPLFFDVAKYPTATFVSDKVTPTGKDTADVHGILTLHGVSHPVILKVKLNKTGISPVTNKMTAGFSATTTLKRSDYGITSLSPGVGDTVKIEIEAEAYKNA